MARSTATKPTAKPRVVFPPEFRSLTADQRQYAIRAAASVLLQRSQFAERAGLTHWSEVTGLEKRDLYDALGYPRLLLPRDYRERYERDGVAETIVEFFPRATWSTGADILEDPDPATETPFEREIDTLWSRLTVWNRLLRADILCGLGQYSVILIGAPGDLESELPQLRGQQDILYLTPLSEERAQIESFVSDQYDPRFGLPEFYNLTLGTSPSTTRGKKVRIVSELSTRKAHWSRVIHVAEGTLEDDIYGKPRLRAVWNYLNDLTKISGGGAEASWRRADPGMQLDLGPESQLDSGQQDELNDEIDEYIHGLRRVIRTRGVDLKLLSSTPAMFGANVNAIIQLICATARIPQRIFSGSERGELASAQDRSNLADTVAERRADFAEPVVADLILRLQSYGALPASSGYQIVWPSEATLSEKEKASLAVSIAQANLSQFTSGGTPIMTGDEIRDRILGLAPAKGVSTAPAAPAPIGTPDTSTLPTPDSESAPHADT